MSEQDEHPTPRPEWSRPVSWTSRPTDQPSNGYPEPGRSWADRLADQPGLSQSGLSQPGVSQPGVSQPGVSHSGPGASQPEVTLPGAAQPGQPQPGAVPQSTLVPGPLGQPPYASQPPYGGQPPHAGQPPHGQPPYGDQTGPPGYGGRPEGAGGRIFAISLVVLLLMGLAAAGGGAVGAWAYARAAVDSGSGDVTVVDAPQLDYTSLASIASQVSPSVVQIRAGDGSGSGVVMSDAGYILTNAHVVEASQGAQVSVRFGDGDTAPASVVGADTRSDIAVVRVESTPVEPAAFGDSDRVLVGDTVLAIGSPLDFQGSVTQGIVSGRDRTLPIGGGADQRRSLSGLLQTDASINPGNSGGPLVNMAGEVIGINTAIATDGVGSGFLGLGFAVPSNRATDVAEKLIAGEEVSHAFMGVSVSPVAAGGALIGDVSPGSPADEAGLREGDIVVRVDDNRITDSGDLVNVVQAAAPGDTLEVEFQRQDRTMTTTVTLTEAPD